MSIKVEVYSEVISAINSRYDRNLEFVDIRALKRINNIERGDKSRTNFYRHALHNLEKQGFLKKQNTSYYFKILKKIDFCEVVDEYNKRAIIDPCQNCGITCKGRRKYYHVNIALNEKHIFCSNECKIAWVFKIQKKNVRKKRLK